MVIEIGDRELFILHLLYSGRCFRSDRGYHRKKLDWLFRKKYNDDAKESIKRLQTTRIIGTIGKSPPKYYISDMPQAIKFLSGAGYSVTKGRERKL
jgi:hypothetical protein